LLVQHTLIKQSTPALGKRGSEIKVPNPKFQVPKKFQIPNLNGASTGECAWNLELEFFGTWNLEFGTFDGVSPSTVVPQRAFVPAAQRLATTEDRFQDEREMFAQRVQTHLAAGGQNRMPMQHDDAFAFGPRHPVEPFAQINFFAGKQFLTETADLPERFGFAKDE
jgi:hypothetical protein